MVALLDTSAGSRRIADQGTAGGQQGLGLLAGARTVEDLNVLGRVAQIFEASSGRLYGHMLIEITRTVSVHVGA